MTKRLLRPEVGLFLVLWLVLMAGGGSRFLRDPGTFWHTVVGERMLAEGRLIDTDPFTFTFAGTPWVPHQWLAEVGMALLHRIDGLSTLLLAAVTLLALLYTWLALRLMRAGLHPSVAAVLVFAAVAASASHFHVRPHLLSVALLAVTFALLTDFEAGRASRKRLLWLVPLFVLWTNVHGGMLGGLGTVALAVAGWVAWRAAGWPSPVRTRGDALALAAVVLACGLTALVNPYGVRLPRMWVEIMGSPEIHAVIQEHAPLDPRDATGVTLLAFGGVYVLLLAGIPPGRPRVCWLLPLVWLYLSVDRVRHAPLFAVVGLVAIADFFPHTRWARRLAASGGDLYVPAAGKEAGGEARPLWPLLAAASAVFALCIGLQAARAPVPVLGHGSARLDPARWPVELLPELRRFEHSRAGGTPVFNEFLYGAFLIYHTPGYRVFVDDRCEVFGGPWLAEFVRAEGEDTAGYIERWERAYGRFDLALTETGSGFDDYFANSPGWAPVRRTPTASLYRREGASPTPP